MYEINEKNETRTGLNIQSVYLRSGSICLNYVLKFASN